MRRRLTGILIAVVLGWAGLVAALWLFQDRLIFLPSRAITATPARVGLDFDELSLPIETGEQVAAWYVRTPRPRRGTLLFCHGNAGNISDRLDSIRTFTDLGLDVLIFDYEGYGASTGSPSEAAFHRDAAAAWAHLVQERGTPPGEIVVFGRSLGGGPAAALAAGVPCAGLILESSFTSVPDMAREVYPRWLVLGFAVRHRFDNAARLATYDGPLLIAHSPGDEIVPFTHGERLFRDARSQEKTFLRMQGGHNDAPYATGAAYTDALDRFLEQALDPP